MRVIHSILNLPPLVEVENDAPELARHIVKTPLPFTNALERVNSGDIAGFTNNGSGVYIAQRDIVFDLSVTIEADEAIGSAIDARLMLKQDGQPWRNIDFAYVHANNGKALFHMARSGLFLLQGEQMQFKISADEAGLKPIRFALVEK